MQSTISVIIPVYKVEEYLEECLRSVINQTYNNLEIILVDDGSPDHCPQLCDEWSSKDSRIKVIHKENGGLSDARNAGMSIATGEYIAFVDSDDYIAPTMYEQLLKGFSYAENIAVVSCQINTDNKGIIEPFHHEWDVITPTILKSQNFMESKMLEMTSHCAWNKLFKRLYLKNIRFMKGRNNEDTLFMYELSKVMEAQKMDELILPDRCYFYRIMRPNSICVSTTHPLIADVIDNLKYITDDCKICKPQLYDKLYPKYVDYLFEFFNSLYANRQWAAKYYKRLKEQVMQVPLGYIWKRYSGNKLKHYMGCRLMPNFRMAWVKMKRAYSS